jgi:serine/threonine-protein kinase
VPSVAGQTERAAVRILTRAGFRVESEPHPSPDVPVGRAVGTRPPAGTEVDAGSRVRLLVSSGPRQIEVPRVVGLTRSSAERTLEARGFGVSVDEVRSDAAKDDVIDQDPAPGATVDEGSTVTITVSSGRGGGRSHRSSVKRPPGPQLRSVPDVTGLSPSDATAELHAAGFNVARDTRTVSDRAQDGTVVDQSPGGGSDERRGSTVTIVVGRFQRPGPGNVPGLPGG